MVSHRLISSKNDTPACSVKDYDPREQLNIIAQLHSNWNGYGASAFSPSIINRAKGIISSIMETGLTPQVFPTAADSIQLEFEKENRYLEFEIYEDRTIHAYMEKGDEIKGKVIRESGIPSWLKDFSC